MGNPVPDEEGRCFDACFGWSLGSAKVAISLLGSAVWVGTVGKGHAEYRNAAALFDYAQETCALVHVKISARIADTVPDFCLLAGTQVAIAGG